MSERASSSRRRGDLTGRKAVRRKRIIISSSVFVLLFAFLVAAKPSYRALKERRANQLAAQGEAMVCAGKLNDAAGRYRAALQLDPLGYYPLSGAARLATQGRRPEAVDLWAQVVRLPEATASDRQEYAMLLLQRGSTTTAEKIIEDLLKAAPDAKTLSVAARYSSSTGNEEKAVQFSRLALERTPEDPAKRFELAEFLAKSNDPASRDEARQILWFLADGEGPSKKSALEALARAPELSPEEQRRILSALNELSERSVVTDLLAAELKLKLQPLEAEEIYNATAARWIERQTGDVAELARWLNLHKQSERVLTLLPVERAVSSEALLLQRLDALADLRRWKEIDTLLERPDLTLDPVVTETFRARNAIGEGSSLDAELHWDRALALAAGNPEKLGFLARFAEQSRANAIAVKAFDQLARFPEHAAFAQRGRQRLIEQTGDATAARTVAERLAAVAPDDINAQAQLTHLNVLLGVDVEANLEKAKALVAKYPARLSFRVAAALGYLRQRDPVSALAQFRGPASIEWPRTPPAWRAVYVAALAETDRVDEARQLLATIPLDRLNKEERELIAAANASPPE